jgi:hypothetical protein
MTRCPVILLCRASPRPSRGLRSFPLLSKAISVPSAADQADFRRFNNGGFVRPAFQAGGSLAGKDSMDASSTMSSASSCGGASRGSIGVGGVSWGCFAIPTQFYSPALPVGYSHHGTAVRQPRLSHRSSRIRHSQFFVLGRVSLPKISSNSFADLHHRINQNLKILSLAAMIRNRRP